MTMSAASATPLTEALAVRTAGRGDADRWNAFVDSQPCGTFFHKFEWTDVISRAFGHRCYPLVAERNGRIEAVLPLAHVNSRLFTNALVSMPFCVYGGVVASSAEASDALLGHACDLARSLNVAYLETRNLEPIRSDWPSKDLYVTFRKRIFEDSDENLRAIPKKQRAMVRKGIKAGLVATVEPNVDALYRCYSESVRNLGTPVFAKRYLETLQDAFGDDCEVLVVRHDGQEVAAVLSFYYRDQVLPYYGGGTQAARALKANDFMYWQVMERARERGARVFDYGRSKVGSGSYRFKKHWGFEPQPLSYEYHLVNANEVPNLSPTNPKYRLFISLWKRLPVSVARLVGPHLAKSLG